MTEEAARTIRFALSIAEERGEITGVDHTLATLALHDFIGQRDDLLEACEAILEEIEGRPEEWEHDTQYRRDILGQFRAAILKARGPERTVP